MRKVFFRATLLALLACSSTCIISCADDYDGDINDLQAQIDALAGPQHDQVVQLETEIHQLESLVATLPTEAEMLEEAEKVQQAAVDAAKEAADLVIAAGNTQLCETAEKAVEAAEAAEEKATTALEAALTAEQARRAAEAAQHAAEEAQAQSAVDYAAAVAKAEEAFTKAEQASEAAKTLSENAQKAAEAYADAAASTAKKSAEEYTDASFALAKKAAEEFALTAADSVYLKAIKEAQILADTALVNSKKYADAAAASALASAKEYTDVQVENLRVSLTSIIAQKADAAAMDTALAALSDKLNTVESTLTALIDSLKEKLMTSISICSMDNSEDFCFPCALKYDVNFGFEGNTITATAGDYLGHLTGTIALVLNPSGVDPSAYTYYFERLDGTVLTSIKLTNIRRATSEVTKLVHSSPVYLMDFECTHDDLNLLTEEATFDDTDYEGIANLYNVSSRYAVVAEDADGRRIYSPYYYEFIQLHMTEFHLDYVTSYFHYNYNEFMIAGSIAWGSELYKAYISPDFTSDQQDTLLAKLGETSMEDVDLDSLFSGINTMSDRGYMEIHLNDPILKEIDKSFTFKVHGLFYDGHVYTSTFSVNFSKSE